MGTRQNPVIGGRVRFFLGKRLLFMVGMGLFLMGQGGIRCFAHPASITAAIAKVQTDGTWQLRLRFDIMSYALGALPNHGNEAAINALLDGPPFELESQLADAKERFQQSFHIKNGGPDALSELTFPSAADVQESVKGVRVRLPVMASVTVSGHLPPGAKTIAFQFDEGLGQVVLTTEFPYEEPISEPINAGAWSEEHPIPSAALVARTAADFQRPAAKATLSRPVPKPKATEPPGHPLVSWAEVAATMPFGENTHATPLIISPSATTPPIVTPTMPQAAAKPPPQATSPTPVPSRPVASLSPQPALAASYSPSEPNRAEAQPLSRWLAHLFQFIKMGYTHILPEGLDHILFVVGLFLLSTRIKPLVQQVTAFTVAHSLTLALSLYGVFRLPASIVEPVIAASIAFVAIENVFTTEMKVWRPAVVFGFGLIHGLGFATALQGIGLKQDNLLSALLGFNVGVELGQLSVVAAAFLVVGRWRNHPNYRKFVVVPASVAIAITAVFWMFQRIS